MKMQTKQTGFTLIELMIVIAIIGILAAIAVPQYQTYTNKAKMSEVVGATNPYKIGVELCYLNTGGFACQGNSGEIPPSPTTASGNVASITVNNSTGAITATATASITGSPQYTLTPVPAASTASAMLIWQKSGSCMGLGLC